MLFKWIRKFLFLNNRRHQRFFRFLKRIPFYVSVFPLTYFKFVTVLLLCFFGEKKKITFSLQLILLVTLSFSPFLYVTACVHPNWIATQQRTSFLVTVYHVQFKCRMPSVIIYRCNYENNHIFPSTKQCKFIDCEFHSTWPPPGNTARVLTTCALTGPESGGTSNRRTLKSSYKCNTGN